MISLKTYLIKKLTQEKLLVLQQKLNIPKDSNNDEFIKYLLENEDYKSFCQGENSKEAQRVYQRILTNANHPEEIRRIQNEFSKNIQKKEKRFPKLFIKHFIAKNLDPKVDAKKRNKIDTCEYCKKSFSKSGDLKTHINSVHNGQKDHKCVSCGKSFSQAHNLKTHINAVHNGQKNHKCDSCGKTSSSAGDLKKHINAVHNGQKDHKCDSCEKTFSQVRNLKKHINAVHNCLKDCKCDICGKVFSGAGILKKHINSVHS